METYQKQDNKYYANMKPRLSRDIANKKSREFAQELRNISTSKFRG